MTAESRIRKRLFPSEPHHITFPTCYRLNTRRQFEQAEEAAGLSLRHLERYADPGYFSLLHWASEAAIVVDWVMERLFGRGRIYFWVALKPAAKHRQEQELCRAG